MVVLLRCGIVHELFPVICKELYAEFLKILIFHAAGCFIYIAEHILRRFRRGLYKVFHALTVIQSRSPYSLYSQLKLSCPLGDDSLYLDYGFFTDGFKHGIFGIAHIPFFAGNFSRLVGQQNIEILFPVGAYFYGKGLGHKKIGYLLVFSQVFNKNFFHTVLSFNKHLSNLIAFIYYNTKGVLPQDI